MLLAFLLVGVGACKYDDDALWDKVNSLDDRVTAVEGQLEQTNSGLSAISTILNALQDNVYVESVTETEDGYQIKFSDGESVTIKDGKDGKDAPVIGVDEFEGKYYWVRIIDGVKSWLTDEGGNKLPVTGEDAVTPQLKVNADGYWLVSYDGGATFDLLQDENGNPVKAIGEDGKDGTDGDSFFSDVRIEGDELVLTLADGTVLRIAIANNLKPLLIINEVDEYWDCLIYENTDWYACIKNMDDDTKKIVGAFDKTIITMNVDAQKRPIAISTEGFVANINYEDDKSLAYCVSGNVMYCDTLVFEDALETRAVSVSGVLSYLKNWVTEGKPLRYVVNYLADKIAPGISSLIDYLRETEDMNTPEKLDYIVDMYENWDMYMAENLFGIPQDWLQKMKDELETEESSQNTPTIIIGIVTGEALSVYTESAVCLVDGYLRAIANEGSFNFDYGICYAESDNPSINDFIANKNLQSSGLISNVTLSLPEKIVLTNLKKGTKYYYRAYFKDNMTNHIIYSDVIRSFTTGEMDIIGQWGMNASASVVVNGVEMSEIEWVDVLTFKADGTYSYESNPLRKVLYWTDSNGSHSRIPYAYCSGTYVFNESQKMLRLDVESVTDIYIVDGVEQAHSSVLVTNLFGRSGTYKAYLSSYEGELRLIIDHEGWQGNISGSSFFWMGDGSQTEFRAASRSLLETEKGRYRTGYQLQDVR